MACGDVDRSAEYPALYILGGERWCLTAAHWSSGARDFVAKRDTGLRACLERRLPSSELPICRVAVVLARVVDGARDCLCRVC